MVVYKILDTELGRVMLGAVGGKLAFCHFVLPSLEAVLERVAADISSRPQPIVGNTGRKPVIKMGV